MLIDLFSLETGFQVSPKDKPRAATEREVSAYMADKAHRLGLPDVGGVMVLHWRQPRDWARGKRYCVGATFGARAGGDSQWGAYSVLMPGYDLHRQRITFEELDEAGEVARSSTLPAEPKKGGVIWSREDVRRAAGKVEKVGKPTALASAPTPTVEETQPRGAAPFATEALQSSEGASLPSGHTEVASALSGPEIALPAAIEPVSFPYTLPGAEDGASDVKDGLTTEPLSDPQQLPAVVADLVARLDVLEARLAALPVESVATPTADVLMPQPPRTSAHERAIRRAWAARAGNRAAKRHLAIGQVQYDAVKAERDHLRNQLAVEQQAAGDAIRKAEMFARIGNAHRDKRKRAVLNARRQWKMRLVARAMYRAAEAGEMQQLRHREETAHRARRMLQTSRAATRGALQRAAVLQDDLTRMKRDMADRSQPERASDIARLIRERDEARNAAAAVNARNVVLQRSVNELADQFEGMVSRVARAEAAVRAASAA